MARLFYVSMALMLFLLTPAMAEYNGWVGVEGEIERTLDQSMTAYGEGRLDGAESLATDAYFNLFEGKGLEDAISVYISEGKEAELEGMFWGLRKAIEEKGPLKTVVESKEHLVLALKEAVRSLPSEKEIKTRSYSLLLNSFIIILREGFEAMLILGAIAAYLRKTGNVKKIKVVYTGAGLAVAASFLTAFVLSSVINIGGGLKDATEGVTALLAAAVLFYVSWWLITKIEVERWQSYIKGKVEGSLERGSAFALGSAAFLAVYREGAETVLFYQALYSGSGGWPYPVILGFILGVSALSFLFIIIKYASVRIPVGPFFAATSFILYYLAFTFAGKGIMELQEARWIPSTRIEGLGRVDFIGFFPTLEGVGVQSAFVFLFMFAVLYIFVYKRKGHLG